MLHRCTADLNKRAGQQRFRLAVSLLAQLVLFAYFQSVYARSAGVFTNEFESEGQISGGPSTQSVTTLEFDKSVERELAGDLEHSYQISLTQGQYASVVIEQRGIDLVAQLLSIDGKPIADFDVEIRNQGRENIELVAETSGNYRLLVKARYSKLPAGRYEVRWVEVREATEKDRLLHEARRLQAESKRLSDAGKYSEALPLAERALELRERVWREIPTFIKRSSILQLSIFARVITERLRSWAACAVGCRECSWVRSSNGRSITLHSGSHLRHKR